MRYNFWMNGFKNIGGALPKNTKFKKRPRYTVVLHEIREKFDLSLNAYVVIDSIHKLSTSDPRYPYCVMSKDDLAAFLKIGRRTVFRSIDEAEKLELIERGDYGLRTTEKWIRSVEIYSIKAH